MSDMICPETGQTLERGIKPITLTYREESITVSMPGWYCSSSYSVHSGEDMKVSDKALKELKSRNKL